MKIYDNTILTDLKECPRKWYWRHYIGIRRAGISLPLTFGLSWHAALDKLYSDYQTAPSVNYLIDDAMHSFMKIWMEQGLPPELDLEVEQALSPRTPGVARDMLYQYVEKRNHLLSNMELIAVEQPFAVPIFKDRLDIMYAGRLDKVVAYDNYRWIIEHKTTTEYKKDGYFKSTFVNQFTINSQCEGYLYAGNLFFNKIDHVQVDGALVHAKVHDGFRFIPFARALNKLDSWVEETRQWISRAEEAELALDQGVAPATAVPRNTYACVGKYGTCPFFDLCHHFPDGKAPDALPVEYIRERWSPFDVLHLERILNTSEKETNNASE